MSKLTDIIAAAGAVLEKAAEEVKLFVTKNTPESALLAALILAFQQFQAGDLNGTQFAFAAFTALVAFMITESNKDKAQIAAQPPASPPAN